MPRTFRFFGPFTEAIIPETDETQQRAAEIAHSYCSVAHELPEREGITSLSFESANRTLKNRPPEPRKEEQRFPESLKTVAPVQHAGKFHPCPDAYASFCCPLPTLRWGLSSFRLLSPEYSAKEITKAKIILSRITKTKI